MTKFWRIEIEAETGDIPKTELLRLLNQQVNQGNGIFLAWVKCEGHKKPKVKLIKKVQD
jgi:hypothetical protein